MLGATLLEFRFFGLATSPGEVTRRTRTSSRWGGGVGGNVAVNKAGLAGAELCAHVSVLEGRVQIPSNHGWTRGEYSCSLLSPAVTGNRC